MVRRSVVPVENVRVVLVSRIHEPHTISLISTFRNVWARVSREVAVWVAVGWTGTGPLW
ncbi:hypothetical protein Hanom_Chr10g00878751 [Helianthus anomalus]